MLSTGLVSTTTRVAGSVTSRRRTMLAALAMLVAVGGAGAGVARAGAAAQQADGPDAALVDRLVELEREITTLPPDAVLPVEDRPWADLTGDFTGTKVLLDTIQDEARDLFIAADDAAGSAVTTAVADVARSLLELREGYDLLARWESHDLSFPVESADDDGVATGADEAYGLAEAGLRLVLDARARRLPALAVLRDTAAADADEQAFLDARYQDEVAFDRDLRPEIHRLISLATTQVLETVDRFDTTAPGTGARARTFTVTCLPRATGTTGADADAPVVASGQDAADCPDLPSGAEVRPIER